MNRRAYTDVAELDIATTENLGILRQHLGTIEDGSPIDQAMCGLETFVLVALKVFEKTNPSKIRDVARIVEIKARMDGVPVAEQFNAGAPRKCPNGHGLMQVGAEDVQQCRTCRYTERVDPRSPGRFISWIDKP